MLAVETYGTASHNADASSSTRDSSFAAMYAGQARITASLTIVSLPHVIAHSCPRRDSAVAGTCRRIESDGSRCSIAVTSSPMPDDNDLNSPFTPALGRVRRKAAQDTHGVVPPPPIAGRATAATAPRCCPRGCRRGEAPRSDPRWPVRTDAGRTTRPTRHRRPRFVGSAVPSRDARGPAVAADRRWPGLATSSGIPRIDGDGSG